MADWGVNAWGLSFLGLGFGMLAGSGIHSSSKVVESLSPQVQVSSALNRVTDLDVQSNLVLSFESAVVLSSDTTLKIHIVHDGGDGFHADSTWNGQVLGQARDFHISLSDSSQIQLSPDGRALAIKPVGDLDFGSNYHIEIDAGAFIDKLDVQKKSAAVGAGTIAFSTVNPVSGGDLESVKFSQKMSNDGSLIPSYAYLDMEGLGSFNSIYPTPLDLSGRSIALTYKDYDISSAQNDAANMMYSGIGVGAKAFNLQVSNFGADDLLYFDDQRIPAINARSGNDTSLFSLAQGLMANQLDGQTLEAFTNGSFVGTLQVDPAIQPTDASQSGPTVNNGAGFLGIQNLQGLPMFQISTMVLSG